MKRIRSKKKENREKRKSIKKREKNKTKQKSFESREQNRNIENKIVS